MKRLRGPKCRRLSMRPSKPPHWPEVLRNCTFNATSEPHHTHTPPSLRLDSRHNVPGTIAQFQKQVVLQTELHLYSLGRSLQLNAAIVEMIHHPQVARKRCYDSDLARIKHAHFQLLNVKPTVDGRANWKIRVWEEVAQTTVLLGT